MRIVRPIVLALLLAATSLALAQGMGDGAGSARLTLENASPQAVSPPVVIVHEAGYAPFAVGAAAPAELVPLAEDGDASELAVVARVAMGVHAVVVAEGPLPPGERVTLEVPLAENAPYLTVLGMLVTTNDAFAHVTIDAHAAAMMGDEMADEAMDGYGGRPRPRRGPRLRRAPSDAPMAMRIRRRWPDAALDGLCTSSELAN